MALDTVKKDPTVLITKASPLEFAKAMYELLDDGGTVVLMNDFAGDAYFTRQDAEAAGFNVIRWGFHEKLPQNLIRFVPYSPNAVNPGTFAVYVLRKGSPRTDMAVKTPSKQL